MLCHAAEGLRRISKINSSSCFRFVVASSRNPICGANLCNKTFDICCSLLFLLGKSFVCVTCFAFLTTSVRISHLTNGVSMRRFFRRCGFCSLTGSPRPHVTLSCRSALGAQESCLQEAFIKALCNRKHTNTKTTALLG